MLVPPAVRLALFLQCSHLRFTLCPQSVDRIKDAPGGQFEAERGQDGLSLALRDAALARALNSPDMFRAVIAYHSSVSFLRGE